MLLAEADKYLLLSTVINAKILDMTEFDIPPQ